MIHLMLLSSVGCVGVRVGVARTSQSESCQVNLSWEKQGRR